LIFNKPIAEVSGRERHLGKMAKHAVNYGMTWKGLIDNALKQGVYLTTPEAKEVIELSKKASPLLSAWHQSIQDKLKRDHYLTTPLGKKRYFGETISGRIGDDTFKQAYAFQAQSTVGQLTTRAMTRLFNSGVDLALEVHDECLFNTPIETPEQALEARELMEETLPVEDMFGKVRDMTIPAELEVGWNYGQVKEVNSLKEIEEFINAKEIN
jgi:DNA polymerase I-like protein with 3'-5' exonuclease and polymerase domains